MSLGKVIKEYRAEHSMTQQAFADRAGVTKAYICMLENGYKRRKNVPVPTIDKYQAFANAMNITVEELLASSNDAVYIGSSGRTYKLNENEAQIIELFRLVPEDDQQLVLGIIEGLLNTKGLL